MMGGCVLLLQSYLRAVQINPHVPSCFGTIVPWSRNCDGNHTLWYSQILWNHFFLTTGPLRPLLICFKSGSGPMGPMSPRGPWGPGRPLSPGSPLFPGSPGWPGEGRWMKWTRECLKLGGVLSSEQQSYNRKHNHFSTKFRWMFGGFDDFSNITIYITWDPRSSWRARQARKARAIRTFSSPPRSWLITAVGQAVDLQEQQREWKSR